MQICAALTCDDILGCAIRPPMFRQPTTRLAGMVALPSAAPLLVTPLALSALQPVTDRGSAMSSAAAVTSAISAGAATASFMAAAPAAAGIAAGAAVVSAAYCSTGATRRLGRASVPLMLHNLRSFAAGCRQPHRQMAASVSFSRAARGLMSVGEHVLPRPTPTAAVSTAETPSTARRRHQAEVAKQSHIRVRD